MFLLVLVVLLAVVPAAASFISFVKEEKESKVLPMIYKDVDWGKIIKGRQDWS